MTLDLVDDQDRRSPARSARRTASSSAASRPSSPSSSASPVAENGFSKPAAELDKRIVTPLVADGVGAISDSSMQLANGSAPRDVVEMVNNRPTPDRFVEPDGKHVSIGNGDVLIAAITSCTNTSNPGVLLAAGLLAKKAVERGLTVRKHIKTSLAPGSRTVTDYLTKAGLLPYLEQLGFTVAAYGCTTCIGNAGDLAPEINDAIVTNDLICAAVLSGNRNFEARIHPNLKANFLASPPLVVAYAIAGTVLTRPHDGAARHGQGRRARVPARHLADVARDRRGVAVRARPGDLPPAVRQRRRRQSDVGPHRRHDRAGLQLADVDLHREAAVLRRLHDEARRRPATSPAHARSASSATRSRPTTSRPPARSRRTRRPASGCIEHGVTKADFNSYGSRRGNHEVMMRGTFANVRIKNLMIPARADGTREEGGVTLFQPGVGRQDVHLRRRDALHRARARRPSCSAARNTAPASSRDWAAKGTQLLGVKAVVARSFERIHRSNLVGMGVLPLQFKGTDSAQSLGITGDETFDIAVPKDIRPQQDLTLVIHRKDGTQQGGAACCAASTRRSRSTTTTAAASCRSCCGS